MDFITGFRPTAIARELGHTYIPVFLPLNPSVLDLGANRGEFTRRMVQLYNARVIAVEANPAFADKIKLAGADRVIAKAIVGIPGSVTLNLAGNSEASSLLASTDEATVEVEGVVLRDLLMTETSIDLMKVDIEGMETIALLGLAEEIRRIRQVCVEFHDGQSITSQEDIEAVTRHLRSYGFSRLKCSVTDYSDVLFIRDLSKFHLVILWTISVPLAKVRRYLYRTAGIFRRRAAPTVSQ